MINLKNKRIKTGSLLAKGLMIAIVLLVVVRCVYLESVEQPASVRAGETVNTTLRAYIQAAEDRTNVRFVIGVLVPRSWRAAENTEMHYTSNFGDGELVQIPANVRAPNSGNTLAWSDALMNKFGIGPNLVDDMEWIVFWTREQYTIRNGDRPEITTHISIKSGTQNMKFKFGYFIASSEDGLNDFLGGPGALYKTQFTDCFDVTDGEGDLLDFCNPPQTVVDPYRSTDNDILTITFDRDILPGPLGEDIFLCANATLTDGREISRCGTSEEYRLEPVSGASGQYEISLWPRQFFELAPGEVIERLAYHFTDAYGQIRVGYANTEEPFVYTFHCE